MEKLIAYLESHKIRGSDLAKSLETSAGYISDLTTGRRTPSMAFAAKIQAATNGEVPISAWVPEGSQSSENAA